MDSALVFLLLMAIPALCRGQSDRFLQTYPPYSDTETRTPLTFALMQSFSGQYSLYDGSGTVAGVQVALDLINNDPELLPGYTLHYTLTDSKCNRTIAFNAFFQQLLSDPQDANNSIKISVIGSGCSIATEPTAEISHFYNLPHISCVSSSTELADRVRFKSYFQLLPTEVELAPAYFGVIKQYRWRRVALIVQNENLFTVVMDRLKELIENNNSDNTTDDINYSEKLFESDDNITKLIMEDELFDPDARIFIIVAFEVHARPLLCEAFHKGLRYPKYMFLTYGWYPARWWEEGTENLNCTADNRASILNNTLAVLQFDFIQHLNNSVVTSSGITRAEYLDLEEAHLGVEPLYLNQLVYAQYCYDATWTLAYALNRTIQDLESGNETFRLEDFTYSNNDIMTTIFGYIEQSNFTGITGPVAFSDLGIRAVNTLRVLQYREDGTQQLDWVEIARVVPDSDGDFSFQYLPGENDSTTWPNDLAPYDGVPNEEVVTIEIGLVVVFYMLATAGILFALVCIFFNAVYRKKKLIRLSSPKLNYLIAIGAMILYIDIYFSVFPTTNPKAVAALCTLTPWLTAIGYSLCYGTVGAKMWRVYYIFNNPTPKRKTALKDWMLALAVGVLIFIDISILLTYTAVEGYRGNLTAIKVPNRENMRDIGGKLDVITDYFVYICDSKARNIFLGVLYGYKGVLQIVTLVLAFCTRKVKVKGLNDAKYILAAIYVSSIVLAVIIVSTYSLKDLINVFAAVFCTGFFIGTTVIMALVFGPKMAGLYKDPQGEKVFEKTNSRSGDIGNSKAITNSADTEYLRKRIRELESMVAKQQNGTSGSDLPEKTVWDSGPDSSVTANTAAEC